MPSQQNNFELSPTIDTTTNLENYTRRSEGYQGNASLGTLIGGVSDILTMAVKGTDQYIKNVTTEEITARVDDTRDREMSSGVVNRDLSSADVPEELKQQGRELLKLSTAKSQGRIKGSSYWARLDLIAREMRSRYPGYREHIDNTISGLVGTTPANALVSALANEADALAKSGGISEAAKFAKANYEHLPEEARASVGTANEWPLNRMMVTAGSNREKDASVKRRKAELELNKAEREVSQEEISDVYNADVNRAFVKVTSKFDAVIDNVTKEGEKLREANAGVLPPEFIQRSRAAIAGAKVEFMKETAEITRNTAYSALNSASKKKTIDDYVKSLDMISDSLENGTFDLAAKGVKALKDNADNLVLSNDVISMDAALYRNLGNDVASRYLGAQTNAQRMSATQELVRRQQLHKMANGDTTVRDIIRASKNNRLTDPVVADIFRAGHDALKSKQIPKETWNNIFNTLYGRDGNPDAVLGVAKNNRDAVQIYQRWSNPATYEAVKAASASDPSIMDRYNRWVLEGARTIYHRELSDIRDTTSQGDLVKIEWTGQGFQAKPAPIPSTSDDLQKLANRENAQMREAVARAWNSGRLEGLNTVVKNLTPVWKAAGLDPKEQSLKLLGVTMEAQDTRVDSGLKPFRELVKTKTTEGSFVPQSTILEIPLPEPAELDDSQPPGITRENLDRFLGEIQGLKWPTDDGFKGIIDFLNSTRNKLPTK